MQLSACTHLNWLWRSSNHKFANGGVGPPRRSDVSQIERQNQYCSIKQRDRNKLAAVMIASARQMLRTQRLTRRLSFLRLALLWFVVVRLAFESCLLSLSCELLLEVGMRLLVLDTVDAHLQRERRSSERKRGGSRRAARSSQTVALCVRDGPIPSTHPPPLPCPSHHVVPVQCV